MDTVRRLLWKLVPPREVRFTCRDIRTFLTYSGPLFLPPEIERCAISLAKDAERTVHSIRVDHMKPEHLALVLVSNAAVRLLSSGAYHTYRGVLSGQGCAIQATFHGAVRELRERGYYTEAEAKKDLEWMRAQIKGVG